MSAHDQVEELLDDWLDGRLDAEATRQVEQHLEGCDRCRGLAEGLRATREAVAGRAREELPPGLEERIRVSLDAEDASGAPATASSAPEERHSPTRDTSSGRLGVLLAAAVLVALAGAWWLLVSGPAEGEPSPVDAAFGRYAELTSGGGDGVAPVADAAQLESRWADAGLGFPTRVIDLSMSGNRLVRGAAESLGDEPAALAVYQGPAGLVACWMFAAEEGAEESLPPADDVHDHRGFHFRVYERGTTTVVLWREGDTLCILASDGGREAAVALAHEKAMAPPLA